MVNAMKPLLHVNNSQQLLHAYFGGIHLWLLAERLSIVRLDRCLKSCYTKAQNL